MKNKYLSKRLKFWIMIVTAIALTLLFFFVIKKMISKKKQKDNLNFIESNKIKVLLQKNISENEDFKNFVVDNDIVESLPGQNEKLKNIFEIIKKNFGDEIAKETEKVFRLETNHFKDEKYIITRSAFITKQGDSYPWGWNISKLVNFWNSTINVFDNFTNKKINRPVIFKTYGELPFDYLAWSAPSVAGFISVAYILEYKKSRGLHSGYYYSNNPTKADDYLSRMNKIKTYYT
jgi:hypothetical protein